jgi:polyferredoxin
MATTIFDRERPERPATALDVLRLPLIGPLLKWRWGRLVFQSVLLIAALAMLWDGFTGPEQASRNLATVGAWVHYRGLVVVALLLVGNLFCMACPFTLPRTLAKRLSVRGRRFPLALRSKWLAVAGLVILFFLYEWLDMWASPALTAWVIVFYFVASFAMEAFFTESAFCKYVCPLGAFNFVYSAISPTQISVRDPNICAHCAGKECVNGSYSPTPTVRIDQIPVLSADETRPVEVRHSPQGTLGCGTLLYAPQIQSNLDCTLCLDCVRACPHDNASLFTRTPGRELLADAWPKRWDVAFLVVALTWMGVTNAFGMVPPVYELQAWLAQALNTQSEFLVLGIIFGVGNVLLPLLTLVGAAALTRRLAGGQHSLREIAGSFAPAFIPLGFGVWFAHYGFHFLIAPLLIVPVIQEFLGGVGEWERFSVALDSDWIGIIQVVALVGGFAASLWVGQRISQRLYRRRSFQAFVPWALALLGVMLLAWWIFQLPMEMRGVDDFLR